MLWYFILYMLILIMLFSLPLPLVYSHSFIDRMCSYYVFVSQVLRLLGAIKTTSEDSMLNWLEKVVKFETLGLFLVVKGSNFRPLEDSGIYVREIDGNDEIVKFLHWKTVLKTVGCTCLDIEISQVHLVIFPCWSGKKSRNRNLAEQKATWE